MLFLLTGEVQIGKTRWLESLVTELADCGVSCVGVLAPGQWVPAEGEHADANGFEKLGIDNVLLPSGERIPFARRGDLARADGTFDEESQAAKAELAWPMRWPSCATTSSTMPRSSSPKHGPTTAAFLPMIQVEPLSCPPVSLGRKG